MKRITAFTGIRNDVGTDSFDLGDLASASNVYIDNKGGISSRSGYVSLHSAPSHSAWYGEKRAMYVRSNNIVELYDNLNEVTRVANVGSRVVYGEVDNVVYWSDGVRTGVITESGNRNWGVELPTISGSDVAGSLAPGKYLLSMAYRRADGFTSGAALYTAVDVVSGGVSITMSVPSDPSVIEKLVYVSDPDGEKPYLVGVHDAAEVSTVYLGDSARTLGVVNEFCVPPPPGHRIFHFAGRMWVADGQFLHYSLPYEYELFDARYGFIGLDKFIRTAIPVKDGIFASTDEATYFISGANPSNMNVRKLADYGGVVGTEREIRGDMLGKTNADKAVMWMSERGVCLGVDGGGFSNVTGDRHTPETSVFGASLFKMKGGTPQFVVTLFN